MNICIITSSFPSRPDDTVQVPFLVEFIRELQKRRHRIFVFTQDRHREKQEFLEGVKINWFPWVKSDKPLVQLNPFKPLDFFRIVNLLYRGKMALPPFIRENRIEVCLSLWVLPGGYFANHALRQTKVPYSVWSLGSDIYRYGRNPLLFFMMKRIIREAKGVFADGFDLSKRIEERFGRKCFFLATTRTISSSSPKEIPSHSPLFIPPTPPLLDGEKELKEGQGVLTSKPYRFLFVGRIEKVKGIDLLLESMARLKEEGPNIHLTVVGRGGMEEWAKRFIKERDLGKQVSWMGNVPDQTLASLYESSDCVVVPSRSESIPLVFSEALKFNKKLIVTDVGDMGTLGRQYGVARVIPPENIGALKEAMKLRADVENHEIEERNENGRGKLKQVFNLETSVERFLADYK